MNVKGRVIEIKKVCKITSRIKSKDEKRIIIPFT